MAMDAIGKNIPFDPFILTQGVGQTQGVEGTADVGQPQSPETPILGQSTPSSEFAYASADAGGLDWNAIANDQLSLQNTSVQMTEIMTLLIEVLSQMRQDARENALKDAQNALAEGLSSAEHMLQAARTTMITSIVGSSVSMMASAGKAVGAAKATTNAGLEQVKGWSEFANQAGSMVSTIGGQLGAMQQAESKADEAQAQYDQTLQQSEQAFFQEMGDAIRALMDSWKGTESATHQAYQGIYNV